MGGDPSQPGLLQQYDARRSALEKRIELYRWLAGITGRSGEPDIRNNNTRALILSQPTYDALSNTMNTTFAIPTLHLPP